MSDFSNPPGDPVRVTEEASTFTESDVNVIKNGTAKNSGSIELSFNGSVVSRPSDDDSFSTTAGRGLVINPNTSLNGVAVTLSSNVGSVQDVFVADTNENILAQKTGGFNSGDTVNLLTSLNSGIDYYVAVYNDGNSYTAGSRSNISYPRTSSDVDIVNGVFGAHPNDGSSVSTSNNAANISTIKALNTKANSGDVLISFDSGSPADIKSYDLATFQRTLDNETLTVDVVDSNGTVLKSDISKDTDISDIATTTDVQLRANLSRNDSANNPTLDYAARRFTR